VCEYVTRGWEECALEMVGRAGSEIVRRVTRKLVETDQNGIIRERKGDDGYVFQAAKCGLELGSVRRHNVAVMIYGCGFVD